ncbi:ABC transporter ATP-binding protein [Jeotgalibacillus sp. ET6]|uniref:ABC transporter ATP-binding protein n=1 Tax=Jeotgalibacillus sp. ET6 TaxID=3037260 RepID=UPI00241858DE|nr:ABC transporter ATP-binding protein [Jeotgalibacillus sp. ET6]MDG5472845.1 ABC transporter ATP-binding protein [Jeotgalibacillus sp. ET6]
MTYFSLVKAHKEYQKKEIFTGIDFSLEKGEILSLVGPSGTGKSTLLRCIAGLEQFTAGHALLEDQRVEHLKGKERTVGMVFQQPLLFPHLTILENVIYGLKLKRSKREAATEGIKYIKSVGLEDYIHAYPHELSGGQQQRIALIRALVLKPKLLLLDEPFSSLDPDLRRELRDWVRMLLKQEKMTAIFVTHDREEAMLLGDKVAVLAEGKIQQIGPPRQVYEQPSNELVARHYADVIVLNDREYAPNHFFVWSSSKAAFSAEFCVLEAQWLNQTYQFGESYAHIQMTGTKRRHIIPAKHDLSHLTPGKTGYVAVNRNEIRSFDKEE